jgi:ribosomal protein S25
MRQAAAKVKKEPDTELLISPALKEKILNKEGVDLRRIDHEYREKKENGKGNGKEKQETKINNQEPVEDSDIDEDEIIDVNLYDQLNREWNKFRWYSLPAIASKMGIHRNTVAYWRDFGIKVNGENIRLKMNKRPFKWYSKGKWIIEFFLKTNANVDMDGA